MFDTQYARRTDTEGTQTIPVRKSTDPQRSIQQTAEPTRLPLYTQAWGNQPPPHLRLSTPQQAALAQSGQPQANEKLQGELAPEQMNEALSELAEVENEDLAFEDIETGAEATRRETVMLGSITHHVEIRIIGGMPVVGIASTWTSLNNIIDTLLLAEKKPGSEISGRKNDILQIFRPAEQAQNAYQAATAAYQQAQQEASAAKVAKLLKISSPKKAQPQSKRPIVRGGQLVSRPKPKSKPDAKDLAYQKKKEQASDARRAQTSAEQQLERVAKEAIAAAWEEFGDFLPANLVPAGEVFKKRPFTGKANKYTYHTGEANDPIPIYWYKPPAHYPKITYNGKTYEYDHPVNIGGIFFGVKEENDPNKSNKFKLRKSAHNETREGQKAFNAIFNDNAVIVGGTKPPALGEKGGYDGDHVKDLGFGGKDSADNYWPLAAHINRRAFNGFNSRYIINYIDAQTGPQSRAIGGLIGRYFIVKGYWNGAVPDETEKARAGTYTL